MTTPKVPARYDQPHWHKLHQLYLNAVAQQSKKMRTALAREIGDTFYAFARAFHDGLLQTTAEVRSNGQLWYTIHLRVSDGLADLAYIEASRLGLDDEETKRHEVNFREMWRLRHEKAPDDASSLTDPPTDETSEA